MCMEVYILPWSLSSDILKPAFVVYIRRKLTKPTMKATTVVSTFLLATFLIINIIIYNYKLRLEFCTIIFFVTKDVQTHAHRIFPVTYTYNNEE